MREKAGRVPRPSGGDCLVECLEERLLMAAARAQGLSGYSGTLSSNPSIRQQQLICDPPEPLRGSTSVLFDPTKVKLVGAIPGPGYDNRLFGGVVEVMDTSGKTFLQSLNSYLTQPQGQATGYVQVRYALSGDSGQLTPPDAFNIVDEGGVDGVDTHALFFKLLPAVRVEDVIEYKILAATANSHGTNQEDFMIVNDGTGLRLGPNDIAPASVSTAPAITYVAGTAWKSSFLDYVESTDQGSAKFGYDVPEDPDPGYLSWTNLDVVTLTFEKPLQSEVEFDLAHVLVRDSKGKSIPVKSASLDASKTVARVFLKQALPLGTASVALDLDTTKGFDRTIPLHVVPGDVNHSGGVNATDLVLTRNSIGRSTANVGDDKAQYRIATDVDGSGAITAIDLVQVRNRIGAIIIRPPTLPASGRYRPAVTELFATAPISRDDASVAADEQA